MQGVSLKAIRVLKHERPIIFIRSNESRVDIVKFLNEAFDEIIFLWFLHIRGATIRHIYRGNSQFSLCVQTRCAA